MPTVKRLGFALSLEETKTYYEWVSKVAAGYANEDEAGLDAVTISFVMTAGGTGVVAHLGRSWEEGSPYIMLRGLHTV